MPFCFNLKNSLYYFLQDQTSCDELLHLSLLQKTLYFFFKCERLFWVDYSLLAVCFLFQHFDYIDHLLLVCKFLNKKSADSLVGIPLYIKGCIAALKIFSLSLNFSSLIIICLSLVILSASCLDLFGLIGSGCLFPSPA